MDFITQVADKYGLTVALVAFVIWDGRNRELRYLAIIDKLSDSFQELKRDFQEFKNYFKKG